MVHATGNTHPGGDKGGLFNASKESIPFPLNNADNTPTASGMTRHTNSFFHCIFKWITSMGHCMISIFCSWRIKIRCGCCFQSVSLIPCDKTKKFWFLIGKLTSVKSFFVAYLSNYLDWFEKQEKSLYAIKVDLLYHLRKRLSLSSESFWYVWFVQKNGWDLPDSLYYFFFSTSPFVVNGSSNIYGKTIP